MDLMVKTQASVPYDRVVSTRYRLEDVNEAMEAAEWSGRATTVTRAILTP
jgi:Zn-dependent alcohol dehydrogenase